MLAEEHSACGAAIRRRPALLAWLLLPLLAGSSAGCRQEEPFAVAPVRSAAYQVLQRLEAQGSAEAGRYQELIREAEAVYARELGRPAWKQDWEAVAAAWTRVQDDGYQVSLALRDRRQQEQGRWAELEPALRAALADARRKVATALLGSREAAQLQQAEVAWQTALRHARSGKLREAIAAGESALAGARGVSQTWDTMHARFEDSAILASWGRWVRETVAESRARGGEALVVDKLGRRLYVFARGRRVDSFPVELGVRSLQQKLHSGDQATPEGRYRVVDVRTGSRTIYYKALLLDYPNAEDRARFHEGRRRGLVPRGAGVGGLIEIHGDGGRGQDWTDGCVALTNAEMDRLLRFARLGTPVTIVGTIPGGTFDAGP